jgi:hypothetical protein
MCSGDTNLITLCMQMSIEYIKNKLATVRGHLVEAQMDFLKDQKMWTSDDSIDWRGLNPVGLLDLSALQTNSRSSDAANIPLKG